jgi:hypothetical protein
MKANVLCEAIYICCIILSTSALTNVMYGFEKYDTDIMIPIQYLSICLWLYNPSLGLGRFFSFLILYTVGRALWTGDQPVTRPLPVHRTTQTQNKHTQTSMPWVWFEPTTPVFKRAKTVHALDCAATVIDNYSIWHTYILVYLNRYIIS